MTPAESFRDLFENAPCGYLILDPDGVVTMVNRTLVEWVGLEEDQFVGRRFIELLSPADQLFFETRFVPVIELEGEAKEIALSLRGAGNKIPVLLNARRFAATDDAPAHTRMAIFDVTQRENFERELLTAQRASEVSEARVRTLQAAASAFGGATTDQQLADLLVASAQEAMVAQACAVLLVDQNGETTTLAGKHPLASVAADPALQQEVFAFRTTGIVAIGSLDEARAAYPWLVDGLIEARVDAFSIVPIHDADGPLGAMMCFFGRPRALSADDIDLQVALADQAAQVLVRLRVQQDLVTLALQDPLTGLANRRLLREHLTLGLAAAGRRQTPLAMIVLDLDGFKSINDAHGHPAGDDVLRWVARKVLESVRADDVVGRFGGDEFMVVCHDADEETAEEVATRLRAAIAAHPAGLPDGSPLTASVGIAVCAPESSAIPLEELFAAADAALYRSKRAGKDRLTIVTL